MKNGPYVCIRFNQPRHDELFEIGGHEDFVALVHAVSGWFSMWVFVGENVVLRRRDIVSIAYIPEKHGIEK